MNIHNADINRNLAKVHELAVKYLSNQLHDERIVPFYRFLEEAVKSESIDAREAVRFGRELIELATVMQLRLTTLPPVPICRRSWN